MSTDKLNVGFHGETQEIVFTSIQIPLLYRAMQIQFNLDSLLIIHYENLPIQIY